MALNTVEKMAYKYFGKIGTRLAKKNPDIELYLESANRKMIKEVFMSLVVFYTVISAVVMVVVATVVTLLIPPLFAMVKMETVGWIIAILVWVFAILTPILVFVGMPAALKSAVKNRGKEIDKMLPYAVNYMSAMASADVNPAFIFRGLAVQEIYGEIQKEAQNIVRDMDLLGMDILTAIKRAIDRSPSMKFKDFLQGIVTTVTSGGSLKLYFKSKSEQYMKENRVEQKGTLETLGVMGESFVTVVVAMPLFLIIILSVMAMMGGGGNSTFLLYVIIGFMIPASQGMFVYVISGMKIT